MGLGTINRDLAILRQQSRENIKKYIDEKLPSEYEKCLLGIDAILKESWITAQQTESNRDKLAALGLAKEAYSMKMDLLTNASVIDDSIRFIAANTSFGKEKKEKAKSFGMDNEDIDDVSGPKEESITEPAASTNNKTF